ncbi:MAG: FAD-dependent thymidylate synthase [Candidatus Bathyarchaeota archaeon]
MKVELIRHTPEPEQLIKNAVSITTMTKPHEKIVKRLIKAGAESPLEHVVFTFKISGVSRILTHQLVRHRIASYTQESQRYVGYEKLTKSDIIKRIVVPLSKKYPNESYGEYLEFMEKEVEFYKRLRKVWKWNKEDARGVLGQCFTTCIYSTMNARSLRNFFKVRCHPKTQWELRELANKMLKLCKEVLYDAFYDIGE